MSHSRPPDEQRDEQPHGNENACRKRLTLAQALAPMPPERGIQEAQLYDQGHRRQHGQSNAIPAHTTRTRKNAERAIP